MNSYDIFIEVAKHKSLSGAAKKLHRTPSAISKQVSQLEQKLNVQLIDRTTRSLSLTEAGQLYYQHCLNISSLMQDAETQLKELSDEPSGAIHITWPEPILQSRVIEVLGEFSLMYPKVDIKIHQDHQVRNLTDDNIDIAFRVGHIPDSKMIARNLFSIEPIFCATPKAIERYGRPETIEALARFPMIQQSNINLQQKARELFPEVKDVFSVEKHASNFLMTNLQLVKQHMGATMIFKHMVKDELEAGRLEQLVPSMKAPSMPCYLMYKKQDFLPKKIRYFVDFFAAAFENGDLMCPQS